MQKKSVLVTGGTGNIGSAVVAELLQYDYQVSVLCRSEQSAEKALKLGAHVISGDIQQPEVWLEQLNQFDGLIHLACGFGEDMGQVDMALMRAVAQATAERDQTLTLLYTSGCWTYGNHSDLITEQTPKTSIPAFQWMLDSIAYLKQQPSIDLRVVSPVNVVDKEAPSVPPILLWELERMGQPCVPESEQLCWALVERGNLAELYRLVLEKGRAGEEYIAAGDEAVTVGGLGQQLSDQPVKVVPISEWQQVYGDWAQGYGLNQPFSSAKAIKELGWLPCSVLG